MKERLYKDFKEVSTREWDLQLERELKGADFEKTLFWDSPEGIRVSPHYRAQLQHAERSSNGILPLLNPSAPGWKIFTEIEEDTTEKSVEAIADAVDRGIEHLYVRIPHAQILTIEGLLGDLKGLKSGHIEVTDRAPDHVPSKSEGPTIFWDPFAGLSQKGRFFNTREGDLAALAGHLSRSQTVAPKGKYLLVNTAVYRNAGALMSQELAYALSIANETIKQLSSLGFDAKQLPAQFNFRMATGPNFFFEIAKYRAFRILWNQFASCWMQSETAPGVFIYSVDTIWNKSVFDSRNNNLRSTTSGMAAVLGGCDAVALMPHDAVYKEAESFSKRTADNIQRLLKYESYFDKVADPAAGSYYVESLTDRLVELAWNRFAAIEHAGGWLNCLLAGEISNAVISEGKKLQKAFDSGEESIIGSNRHPDKNEKAPTGVNIEKVQREVDAENCLFEPLEPMRLTLSNEKERLQKEANTIES